jgi:hypothetical protein
MNVREEFMFGIKDPSGAYCTSRLREYIKRTRRYILKMLPALTTGVA